MSSVGKSDAETQVTFTLSGIRPEQLLLADPVSVKGAVVAWLRATSDADLHLSAVTIGELQAGIEITREQDAAKAAEIEAWLEQVAASYNILAMDGRIFRCWARLMHRRSEDLLEDAMIDDRRNGHGTQSDCGDAECP